jgi:hypothetical protein
VLLLTCRESRDVPALFFRLYPPAPLGPPLTHRHPKCPPTKNAPDNFPPRERTSDRSPIIAPPQLPSPPFRAQAENGNFMGKW